MPRKSARPKANKERKALRMRMKQRASSVPGHRGWPSPARPFSAGRNNQLLGPHGGYYDDGALGLLDRLFR